MHDRLSPGVLHDLERLRLLKARYFRFVDDQQLESLRSLFTPDAELEFPSGGGEPMGVAQFVSMVGATVAAGTVTIHQGGMPELTLTGSDSAQGIWQFSDVLRPAPGALLDLRGYPDEYRSGFRGLGRYHETYRRVNGAWLIASLRVERLLLEPLTRSYPPATSPPS